MQNAVDSLMILLKDTDRDSEEAKFMGDKEKALRLSFRRQEINNLLCVAKLWAESPPGTGNETYEERQKELDDYIKASIDVANSIRELMKDSLSMGNHAQHFEREHNSKK